MATQSQRPQYHVYLLRLWKEPGASQADASAWRFSLENPHTHERHGFTSIAALTEFLDRTTSTIAFDIQIVSETPAGIGPPDSSP